jgi:cytochrome oxidase Cu insertion factor (SCO1/SenC/PrrC family)
VLHRLDGEVAAEPALRRRVRLVTLSFDPERDTPARLASARALHEPRTDWAFATAPDEALLGPLLMDFGQPVARLRFDDGRWTGLFRHVLKVFLVDRRHRVRNVYSTGFLHPELILNDVRTVLLERDP